MRAGILLNQFQGFSHFCFGDAYDYSVSLISALDTVILSNTLTDVITLCNIDQKVACRQSIGRCGFSN